MAVAAPSVRVRWLLLVLARLSSLCPVSEVGGCLVEGGGVVEAAAEQDVAVAADEPSDAFAAAVLTRAAGVVVVDDEEAAVVAVAVARRGCYYVDAADLADGVGDEWAQ